MESLKFCHEDVGKRRSHSGTHRGTSDLYIVLPIEFKIVHLKNHFEECGDSAYV